MTILTGTFRIGRDSELRYLTNGDAVTNLSLAYNFGKKGVDNNRPAQWVDASLFGKRAESMSQYLLKGGQIWAVIDGLHIEEFKKKDGSSGTKLVGNVIQLEFVGPRQADLAPQAPPQRQAPAPAPTRAAQPQGIDEMESDIPFVSSSLMFDIESKLDRRIRRAGR